MVGIMDAEKDPEQAASKVNESLDRGCLFMFWTAVGIGVFFAIVVAMSVGGSDNEKPSGDACTRAFIKDTELLTKCYQIVGTGVSSPDAVVIVRNTVRDYGRP